MRLRRVVLTLNGRDEPTATTVRAAGAADLRQIVEIDAEAFPELPYPAFFLRQAIDALAGLLRIIEHPAGEIAGYALGVMTAGEREGWLLSMAVRSSKRGIGLASTLLTDMDACFAARGAGRVLLTVEPRNAPARRLYARHGFVDARDEPDYFGPGETRLVMGKALAW